MAEVKPCPFCGRTPTVDDCGDHRYFVRCKCGIAQDKLYAQKCDAVRRWNTRKTGKIDTDTHVPDTNVGDTISRQAAIKAVCERECTMLAPCEGECKAIMALRDLPSAQPQRMRGRWIDINGDGTLFRCSSCDEIVCC